MDLSGLLHQTFGFDAFRANQEAVCLAAAEGRDVLLVMPTGAGKSLCYQLPSLARGATALVISPLIALMEDQSARLASLGLRVARIHSGLTRDESRQACRDYLNGTLQFLFIAPERLRVPGFPEMLSKRQLALVAIDEAHCISQWGHDFRPDYRTLGDYLPALRPAPVIALTATATPTVQRDIISQLRLQNPALFIHGFRRHNLAIEVVELSKPRRDQFAADLLGKAENRPAIVYAPSRKASEALASLLGRKAAAYHAGLEPDVRESVQRRFLAGELEIVVATIAFGMGIDKPDIRTVIHTALPSSVEAYYQEIGRAGRDGMPSRTVLLHSFADRKMHDWFLERDYPEPSELERLAAKLTPEFESPETLRRKLKVDVETFNRIAEKLVAQGAAALDIAGNLRATGQTGWRAAYEEQLAFRRDQIDRVVQFAETPQCRMAALVQHFGDTADGLRPCGQCDFCSPERATAQQFRAPTAQEERQLRAILDALGGVSSKSTGRLHSDLALGIARPAFNELLDGLTRAGLIAITADSFTNPAGELIHFKRASLTHEGRQITADEPLSVLLKNTTDTKASKSKKERSAPAASAKKTAKISSAPYTPAEEDLNARLREWRKAEAAKTGKPAFIVLCDSALDAIVRSRPRNLSQLLEVPGIGPDKADRYGAAILALCASQTLSAKFETAKTATPRPATKPDTPSMRSTKPAPPETKSEKVIPIRVPDALTPEQQALDTRLRRWRQAEAEKLGMPQFFVLGSSTLRNVVLARPQTLAQLKAIDGMSLEKLDQFGASILEACKS